MLGVVLYILEKLARLKRRSIKGVKIKEKVCTTYRELSSRIVRIAAKVHQHREEVLSKSRYTLC